jgi:hypothetical protein
MSARSIILYHGESVVVAGPLRGRPLDSKAGPSGAQLRWSPYLSCRLVMHARPRCTTSTMDFIVFNDLILILKIEY